MIKDGLFVLYCAWLWLCVLCSVEELDAVVSDVAMRAFVRTDQDFLERSPHPEAGSTATVTLILGKRCVDYTRSNRQSVHAPLSRSILRGY